MMDDISEGLQSAEFAAGIRFGVIALVVGLAIGMVARRRGQQGPVPIAGALLVGAACLGLQQADRVPAGLAYGIGALALAGAVAQRLPAPRVTGAVLAAPGAYLIAYRAGDLQVAWTQPTLLFAIPLGASLVADFDRRWRPGALGPVLLAVTVAGVFSTVPDTEHALVLLGAAAPVALLGWPLRLASLGVPGTYAATGLVLWTIAVDGVGRESSIVGGLGCLGLLIVEPAIRAVAGGRSPVAALHALGERVFWRGGTLLTGTCHGVVVLLAARVAGLRASTSQATAIVLAELVLVLGAGTALAGQHARGDEK